MDCDQMGQERSSGWVWIFVALAVASVVASALLTWDDWASTAGEQANWDERGVRGDFWGGHIASGASLAGSFLLFAAIMFQRVDLRSHFLLHHHQSKP